MKNVGVSQTWHEILPSWLFETDEQKILSPMDEAEKALILRGRERFALSADSARPALRIFGVVLGFVLSLAAQQPASTAGGSGSAQPQQDRPSSFSESTSNFIGYATNGSFLFPDIATSPGPLTTAGKFKLFVNQSISPPYIVVAASGAAFDQARDFPEGYGQGWNAYGGRFGMSLARASSSSFFGTFAFASLLHQDPRFFPQSKPSFGRSLKYSAQRIVITRNDAGKDVFNASGLFGPLAAEGLANVYLPTSQRTVGNTFSRYGWDLVWRFGGNMFKDYWPTFFHRMGLNQLKVIPDPGKPGTQRN
jgi:hypothetical protein